MIKDKNGKPMKAISWLAVFLLLLQTSPVWAAIDISDSPVDTKVTSAPPIIMFVLDDSGSMDWEYIVEGGDEGRFQVPGGDIKRYVFDMSDNIRTGSYLAGDERLYWKSQWAGHNKMYYNPLAKYQPWPNKSDANTTTPRSNPENASPTLDLTATFVTLTNAVIIDNKDDEFTKTGDWDYTSDHSEAYDRDFWDTSNATGVEYTAKWTPSGLAAGSYEVFAWWRSYDTYSTSTPYTIKHAGGTTVVNVNQELYDSQWNSLGVFTFNGDGTEYVGITYTPDSSSNHACADAVKFETSSNIEIKNAHYFAIDDTDADGELDASETIYLVSFNSGAREYYEVTATGDKVTALTPVDAASAPDGIKPKVYDDSGSFLRYQTDAEDLQNFANWFSFYRRRELAAKAAVSNVIDGLEGAKVGFYSINSSLRQTVLPVKLSMEVMDTIIIDNKDSDFTKSGSWTYDSDHSEGYERDFWDSSAGYGSPYTARWTPSSMAAGQYEVFAWWRSYDTYSTATPYTIKHAGGTTTVQKNQERDDKRWNSLGIFTFNGDGTEYVEISYTPTGSSDHVCADAVKFEQLSGGTLQNVDDSGTLISNLYGLNSSGGTPLRTALKSVGQYLDKDDGNDGNLGDSPLASEVEGGACQQAFSIVMTDGFWNGDSPDVGNQDSGKGVPFEDGYSDSLADVAMKYHLEDLSNSVANQVPTNSCDGANYQHMVTYTVSFGQSGTLTPPDSDNDGIIDDPCFLETSTPDPTWPDPANGDSEKIDDLWHAAVNGRGAFYSATDPQGLIDSLRVLFENIASRKASSASVSVNGEELGSGTVLYQSIYSTGTWTGDVIAYPVNPVTGAVNREESAILWKASDGLINKDWDTERNIVTYNGTSDGIAFRYDEITGLQKTALGSDLVTGSDADLTAEKIVEFIRGNDVSGFRTRNSMLGDIVHSAPVLIDDTVFVGANDGMMHAFNASDGTERFAYVPNLVFENLHYLKESNFDHKFFVDLTPTVQKNVSVSGIGSPITMLVGGLGKGGKGYYALNISPADSTDISVLENTVADMVLWEYPKAGVTDDDLGYSFSKPFIVRSNASGGGWVVIFGNGYNSVNDKAILYILDTSGNVIKKIDTGASGDNGLSTPALIDVNNDHRVDYIYAGDLKGNMWKFDLTDTNYNNWGVAYDNGTDPQPLFQAPGQVITSKPDVMMHPAKNGYLVIFGTGKYLGESDRSNLSLRNIFGIWDYGDDDDNDEYLGVFDSGTTPSLSNQADNVTLLEQTEIDWRFTSGHYYRTLSNNEPNWATVDDPDTDELPDPGSADTGETVHAGWYVSLIHSSEATPSPEGERVVRDVIIRDGKAIVTSTTPNASPCSGGGDSVIHEIDAASGGRLSIAQMDINGDGIIDDDDLITPNDPDGNPILDDDGNPIKVPPSGKEFTGVLYQPVFLTMPDKVREMKLFSTSAGTTETVFEKAEKKSMVYWRVR